MASVISRHKTGVMPHYDIFDHDYDALASVRLSVAIFHYQKYGFMSGP